MGNGETRNLACPYSTYQGKGERDGVWTDNRGVTKASAASRFTKRKFLIVIVAAVAGGATGVGGATVSGGVHCGRRMWRGRDAMVTRRARGRDTAPA
uniref:Uncharacterized protein n=1 Tax=Oryza brachyantha TaxID=4533 RepID=J3N8Q9_ORYBR